MGRSIAALPVARLLLQSGLRSMVMKPEHEALRYLHAAQVAHPAGTLAGVEIRTERDERLGCIGGVLVEPAQRRVRYFVVERGAFLKKWRYLVSADRLATLNAADGTIYIDGNEEIIERFDPASVPLFSDDDLIKTMFAPTAA
jgi:hypothetical protein